MTLFVLLVMHYLFFLFIFIFLPILALVDIVKNEFTGNNKIIWVLIVLLAPILGPILYFIMGSQHKL